MKFAICSARKTFERPRSAHRKLRYYGEGFGPFFGAGRNYRVAGLEPLLVDSGFDWTVQTLPAGFQLRLHTATRRRLAFTVFVGHAPTYDQRHNLEEGRTLSR